MARTRSLDYDSIKANILDNAARLFAERGFTNTSILDISAASGLSKAGIYHYFASKTDILDAMLGEYVGDLLGAIEAALAEGGAPADRFRRLTGLILETYGRARHRHTVLMRDLDALPALSRDRIVAAERHIVHLIEDALVQVKPALAEAQHARGACAMLYLGMLNWTDNWFRESGPLGVGQLATLAGEVFLNGLVATALPARDRPRRN